MTTIVLKSFVVSVLVGSAALVGCAHDQAPPAAEPTGMTETTSTQVTTTTTPAPQPVQGVQLSSDILQACKVDVDNVSTAPKFGFDDSTLGSDERNVLDQVAKCVTTGPLKGRSLQLIGRADPRGEEEYNMELGSQRAESVKSYLTQDGVGSDMIDTTSRGKLDATGTDEAGWAQDRRVDINLK